MKRLANHLVALISAVAAIAAVTALLASGTVKTWAREDSSWVYAGLVIAALIAFLAVDWAIGLHRQYRDLKASVNVVSDHDKRLLHEVLALIPLDGDLIMWLKNRFYSKRIPARQMDALRQISEQLSLHSVGFDNPQVNDAYRELLAAIEAFDEAVIQWAIYEHGKGNNLQVPLDMKESEGGEERYYAALREISDTVTCLVGAYDAFLQTCQQNGMSIYAPEPSAEG